MSFANLPPLTASPLFTAGALPSQAERAAAAAGRFASPAKKPTASPAASSTSAAAVESTQDVPLEDISFGDVRRPNSADNTQDVSLTDISAVEMDVARAKASPARNSEAADSEAMRRWRRESVGIALAALAAVLGTGWFALSGNEASGAALEQKAVAPIASASSAGVEAAQDRGSAASEAALPPTGATPMVGGQPASDPPATDEARAGAQAAEEPASEATLDARGSAPEQEQAVPEQTANAESPVGASGAAQPEQPALDATSKLTAARAGELVKQAHALQKHRKYVAATARYRDALSVYPDYPRALAGLVQLAIHEHDGKQAVSLAKQLVRAEPEELGNLVLLGDAYKSAHKRKEAHEAWQNAARAGSAMARARLKH